MLTDASVRDMWRPVRLTSGGTHPYGLGWELAPFRQMRSVHHAGSLPGFRANYLKLLDERLTIILLTNAEAVDRDAILAGVTERMLRARGGAPRTRAGRRSQLLQQSGASKYALSSIPLRIAGISGLKTGHAPCSLTFRCVVIRTTVA